VRAKYNSTQTPSRFYLPNLNGTMVVMVHKSQAPTPTPDVALPWWGLCDLRWRFPKMRSVHPYLTLLLTPRVANEYVVEYLQGLHPEMTISKCLLQ
jgi:hypothetical protein